MSEYERLTQERDFLIKTVGYSPNDPLIVEMNR
jgi:hypothetical protein